MSIREVSLFKEGDWEIFETEGMAERILRMKHHGCVVPDNRIDEVNIYYGMGPDCPWRWSAIEYDTGDLCYWCEESPPAFIQQMWTFVMWANNTAVDPLA